MKKYILIALTGCCFSLIAHPTVTLITYELYASRFGKLFGGFDLKDHNLICRKLVGGGLIRATRTTIRAHEFLFDGTFECSEECHIYTQTALEAIKMKRAGEGKIIIHSLDKQA